MTDPVIVTQLPLWSFSSDTQKLSVKPPDLHTLAALPRFLPTCVTASPMIMRCLELLSPLDWAHFPERNLQSHRRYRAIPYAALATVELIRLNETIPSVNYHPQYAGCCHPHCAGVNE